MDIVLKTNSDNHALEFRDFTRFADGSGYTTRLAVRSGWVSALYDFCFESEPLLQFLVDLERIDLTMTGLAQLKPMWEAQYVEFQGIGLGHIQIRGELIEHGQHQQRLKFEFATDQTCLRPFITSFQAFAHLPAIPANAGP